MNRACRDTRAARFDRRRCTARDSTALRSRLNPFSTSATSPPTPSTSCAMDFPGVGDSAVFRGIAVKPLPGLLVLVEEVILDAVEDAAREPGRRHVAAGNHPHVAGENRPAPVVNRAVRQKPFDASCQAGEDAPQPFERLLASALGGQVARARSQARDRAHRRRPAAGRSSWRDRRAAAAREARQTAAARSRRCAKGRGRCRARGRAPLPSSAAPAFRRPSRTRDRDSLRAETREAATGRTHRWC